MRRFIYLIFLILIMFGCNCFSNKVDFCDYLNKAIVVKVITKCDKENDVDNVVYNGNYGIIKVNKIKEKDYIGITFIMDSNFQMESFINYYKIHIYNKYYINNILVFDGKILNKNTYNFENVQIAIMNEKVVIGFPSILEGF